MKKPTTIDLFCGAGGITEGFRRAGFECVFGTDANEDALRTFTLNHPRACTALAPIEKIDAHRIRTEIGFAEGELDCLVGGPPCQGFSINAPERAMSDPRNDLFRHYVRFIEEFKPKLLVFENVPGMLSLANGQVATEVVRSFENMGYDVAQRILFAGHYGVPQERWRLIILGSRIGPVPEHPRPRYNATARANFTGGRTHTFRLDELTAARLLPRVTVGDAIGDLPRLRAGGGSEEMPYEHPPHSEYARKMRHRSKAVRNHIAAKIAPINVERLKYIKPGGSWRDIPYDLLPAGMKKARQSDHTRRYGRLRSDGLSGTVMTKMDPHWGPAFHYEQARTLTVREAARLQSFPDRYAFTGSRVAQYEQVGNAVPVLMAEAVAGVVRKEIDNATAPQS